MNKEFKKPDLQQGSLRENPFRVPEGYFESFPDRLKDRISRLEDDQVPVRKLAGSARLRIALAASIIGLALISYPLVRLLAPGDGYSSEYPDITLLEGAGVFSYDDELAAYLDEGENTLDEEEAYLNQAMEYLAMNDVEMDLIFE
jgi:hypothetical protein